ncbi:MAG: hypothetical protein R3C69_11425 [Geminicoccaceae bacterium]
MPSAQSSRRPATRPITGKWHLGEADHALLNAQGYDGMKYASYHLNAYTYPDPKWHLAMSPELRQMFEKITTGALSGNAGEKAAVWKVNGEYVDTPDKGVVGIPYLDAYVEEAALDSMTPRRTPTRPSHQRQLHEEPPAEHPASGFRAEIHLGPSTRTCGRARRVVGNAEEARRPGLADNTVVFYTVDNGAWQDVYPDAGYTSSAAPRAPYGEGGNRVPSMVLLAEPCRRRQRQPRHPGRPRSDGHLLRCSPAASRRRPREQADHLRQLRHDPGHHRRRPVRPQGLVLLHRGY